MFGVHDHHLGDHRRDIANVHQAVPRRADGARHRRVQLLDLAAVLRDGVHEVGAGDLAVLHHRRQLGDGSLGAPDALLPATVQ